MGKRWSEVQEELKYVSYKVVKSGVDGVKVETDYGSYTPQEISAFILQKMKQTAEDYLGHPVKKRLLLFQLILTMNKDKLPKMLEELLV
jgi:molecular chaperone DnaK